MCYGYGMLCILFVSISQIYGQRPSKGCSFDVVNTENQKFQTLLFHNRTSHYDLAIPERGRVNLNSGARITLACTGNRNYLTETNSNATSATCVGSNTLRIFEKDVNYDELQCKKNVGSSVRNTRTRCGNGEGYIKEIGYQVTTKGWSILIKVCYDDDRGATLYSEHNLYGYEIKYATKATGRPGFSKEGLGAGIAAAVAYTKAFQKSTFNKLLNSAKLAKRYINERSFLARGHLSPVVDFLLTSSKCATFYFINVTPQWQAINGGNWKSVESNVRKAAESYNRTFAVITGTHGVLTLPDANQKPKRIYLLAGDKLPVPKTIWKIVYDRETQMGIAIISPNNPFMETISQGDFLCDDICDRYGWSGRNWKNIDGGFVYCCDLKKFLKVVPTTPRLKVRGVLQFAPTN